MSGFRRVIRIPRRLAQTGALSNETSKNAPDHEDRLVKVFRQRVAALIDQDPSTVIDWLKYELDQRRFSIERGFFKTYFSFLVTAAISLSGLMISGVQVYYGQQEKRANEAREEREKRDEADRQAQEQEEGKRRDERDFSFKGLEFFAAHRNELQDSKAKVQLAKAAKLLFPPTQQIRLVNVLIEYTPVDTPNGRETRQTLEGEAEQIQLPTPRVETRPPSGKKLAVYVQYLRGYDRDLLNRAVQNLRKHADWVVGDPQEVPYAPRRSDVRYYYTSDVGGARDVLKSLQAIGVEAKLNNRLVAKNTHRQGVIEVWLRN